MRFSMGGPFAGVAFLRGDPQRLSDNLIMRSTGGPFVHTEFILGNGNDIRCYTACGAPGRHDTVDGFVPSGRMAGLPGPPRWDVVTFPILGGRMGYNRAYAVVLQLVAMHVPYNYHDLWQCCVKVMLPYERDIQCDDPVSWRQHGVFCSQACLLLLRCMARRGLIATSQPLGLLLERTNSRGCSPNALHHIVSIK